MLMSTLFNYYTAPSIPYANDMKRGGRGERGGPMEFTSDERRATAVARSGALEEGAGRRSLPPVSGRAAAAVSGSGALEEGSFVLSHRFYCVV